MTLETIKTYLETRAGAEDLVELTDTELTKYCTTAFNLLDMTYELGDLETDDPISFNQIVAEETIYVYKKDIDLDLVQDYNGLDSFNIGGSIQGSLTNSTPVPLFSKIVKNLLKSNDIFTKISQNEYFVNAYTSV